MNFTICSRLMSDFSKSGIEALKCLKLSVKILNAFVAALHLVTGLLSLESVQVY